jgi:hypothetical protein
MAVRTQGSAGIAGKVKDEVFLTNEAVSLCLLLNRRARAMRIIDFRAGPHGKKREAVLKFARQQQMEKVYTLVERDEVSTWTKLGFAKEGNIPGFYKRSDAFLLGCAASAPISSETRIAVARVGEPSIAQRLVPELFIQSAEEEDVEEPAKVVSLAAERAEKTLARAKRNAKSATEKSLPRATVTEVRENDVKKSVERAVKAGTALTAFEPFGRDVTRRYFSVSARGGFELVASIEQQACFGNAFLELLTSPKNDADAGATKASLRALAERLAAEGTVSVFSLVPSDDVVLATIYVACGFRRTGVLENHMVVGGESGARKDAILFSKKLANPTGD